MTRNLKVTFCTAAISTSSFVRPGDLGYSAAILAVTMLWRSLAKTIWQSLPRFWRDPYRPELHYMRGPGPKWREKHSGRFEQGTLDFGT
jgi:hypothetical protein